MSDIQDDDYGFFYDIEDEYNKEILPKHRQSTTIICNDKRDSKKYIDRQDRNDKSEILYKCSNYCLGIVTICITVASFYEIFS